MRAERGNRPGRMRWSPHPPGSGNAVSRGNGRRGGKAREIFAPVHQEFAQSGMTEEELYHFLEEVREEVWQEKQPAKGDE